MEELIKKLERKPDSHKGENGKVLVIGGSQKYTGAPALAAEAALRAGADLVKILTAEKARPVVQSFSENLIVESYGEKFDESSLERALELNRWADSTAIGPGLSEKGDKALKKFGQEAENLVIDAEAIQFLTHVSENIFTPHKTEAKVFEENFNSIQHFVSKTGNTVLLKGSIDKIYAGQEIFRNESGNASMTVGGTGDVLTGIVAGLKAQDLSDVEASRLAAYVNGKAGEKACQKFGNGLLATDLIEEIPKVLQRK